MFALSLLIFFLNFYSTSAVIDAKDSSIPAVSKVWVINLPSRSERMEFMDKQLTDLKIPYERFEAFDFGTGNDTKAELARARLHPQTKVNFTLVAEELAKPVMLTMRQSWGTVGCWQSHLQILMKIAYDENMKKLTGPFLVLEDDVEVASSISKYLSFDYLFDKLPAEWDMIYFDHLGLKCKNYSSNADSGVIGGRKHLLRRGPAGMKMLSNEFCKINFTYATGGYVIRDRDVALKLLEAGNTPEMQVADKYTNPLFRDDKLHAYAIFEKVVYQLPAKFGSDIRTPEALKDTIKKFYSDPVAQPQQQTQPAAQTSQQPQQVSQQVPPLQHQGVGHGNGHRVRFRGAA